MKLFIVVRAAVSVLILIILFLRIGISIVSAAVFFLICLLKLNTCSRKVIIVVFFLLFLLQILAIWLLFLIILLLYLLLFFKNPLFLFLILSHCLNYNIGKPCTLNRLLLLLLVLLIDVVIFVLNFFGVLVGGEFVTLLIIGVRLIFGLG